MKKILLAILAVAAMSAACTKFAEDVTPAYDTVGKPLVEANVSDDDSLTVIVTAGENTSYYGYVVVQGTLDGVTAEKLVANGYSKNALVQGSEQTPQSARIQYTEETQADTLYLSGLTPYTDYTVYAAAVSPMGVCSEVVAVTVKTTDGTEPIVNASGFDFKEANGVLTFAIPFSDPVALTGNGTAKAYFYAENYYDETGMLVLYKEVDIPADHMATSGKNLILAVPAAEYIPGAYVAVTYSADMVVNGAGAKNVAYEDHLIGYNSKGQIQKVGMFGYYDYVNWDFSLVDPSTLPDDSEEGEGSMEGEEEEEEKEPVYFSNWSELMMTAYSTSEYSLGGKTGDGGVTIVTKEPDGRSVSYAAKTYGAVSATVVAVTLNEAPAYGATVSFTIEEGTFCDIFGNVNNEFTAEDEYFCSYGYTLNDIVGSYSYGAYSAYSGAPVEGTWTIAASDNPEKGNVMFTEMYGTECEWNVYAQFDMVSGKLTIPSLQLYASSEKYLFAFCSSDNSGNISNVDVVFAVPQAGVINGQSGYFGDAAINPADYSPLGFFDVYYGFSAVRGEAAPVAAPAPAKRSAVRTQL